MEIDTAQIILLVIAVPAGFLYGVWFGWRMAKADETIKRAGNPSSISYYDSASRKSR